MDAYLRSLNPRLPRAVWVLQLGGLASSFGNGLATPFLLIYLHNVRGMSIGTAGLVIAAAAMAGLLSGPVAGTTSDRVGPRATLAAALLLMSIGYGLFPLVRAPWHAFALMTLVGIGTGGFWPAQSVLTAGLTPRMRTHAAFSMQRVMNNLGIGLGAGIGGLIATTSHPVSFDVLFLLDAATFLVFAAVLRIVPPVPALGGVDLPRGYGRVLRDRIFVSYLLLNAMFITLGFGFIELLAVYAKNFAAVSERGIGLVFLANTMFIVVAQLPVTRVLEGRRRMPALLLMALLWAATWLLVAATGHWLAGTAATALLVGVAMLFGAGETIHGAISNPLAADLAEPRLIGRYMALLSVSWQLGLTAGPALGGVLLDASPTGFWLGAAAACAAAGLVGVAFEARLPAAARRTPRDTPAALPAAGASAPTTGA